MFTISYKGLFLSRRGTRVAVSRADGDILGTFHNWNNAIAFVDKIRDCAGVAVLVPA